VRRVPAALAAAALLLGSAAPVTAQQRAEPWLFRLLIFPSWNGLEGFGASLLTGWRAPARPGPVPTTAAVELSGKLTTSGTRGVQLAYDAPGLWRDWRLLALAGVDRATRAPYFGLGNEPIPDSLESPFYTKRYFRYSLLRTTALAAVQRRLTGPVRLMVGAQARHYRALPLDGDPTRLSDDLAAGLVTDTGSGDGVELKGGLLYDTRDEEASPSRGLLLEALVGRGLGGAGDWAYTRWLLGARQFIPLGEFTTLALRQTVELADRDLPFFIAYERLTGWRPEDGFGSPTTLRTHLPGRFLASNRALVSADLRYKKWDVPLPRSPFRLWLLAFGDVGRVWLDAERPSLEDLHLDAGVGFRLQFSKGSMFGLDVGMNNDTGFEFGTSFVFGF
jgi:hypothetical protein